MKFWPIIGTVVTLLLGAAVPAVLWSGGVSARLSEVERKVDKIVTLAEDVAAIKAILERSIKK